MIRVQAGLWECLHCPDPFTGGRPFRFADHASMEKSEADASWVWEAVYGEPMPASKRGLGVRGSDVG